MVKDAIFESTYAAIKEFIAGKHLGDLVLLHLYISTSSKLERPPYPIEREFIKEFFTDDGWANHVQAHKRALQGKEDLLFTMRDPFDLQQIQGMLSVEISKLTADYIKDTLKLTKPEPNMRSRRAFKEELEAAMDGSYYDGVFDKCDGFSNLYSVLVKHKLLKERED